MLTADEGFGAAARRGKFTRGVKSDAPATRKNCRRLEHGLMSFLLRLGAERDEKNAMAVENPRDDRPTHPGQVLCLALIRPMVPRASPAKSSIHRSAINRSKKGYSS